MQHSLSSELKKLLKELNSKPLLIVSFGLFIFFAGASRYYQARILSFSKVPKAATEATANLDIPTEIIVPSINIDLKVEPGQIKDGVWLISEKNATFLDTSAVPGSGGDVVIYGHNKKVIFGSLPYVSIGQKITIKTKSGKLFNYITTQKYFVGPDRVDLVSPTNTEELTIYTCWGLFDLQRAIIKAAPLKQ